MKRIRLISLFLAVLMLLGAMPVQTFSATERSFVHILHNGTEISELLLPEDGQETLEANTALRGTLSYQWQILSDVESYTWVDINGMTASTCNVTYALVASLLDEVGQTQLRCFVSNGTEKYFSESVTVLVSYTAATPTQAQGTPLSAGRSRAASFRMVRAAANDEIKDVYNITINYIYKDGSIARESNVLNIQAGTAVNHVINNPDVVGYEPVLQEDYPYVSIIPQEDGTGTAVKFDYASLDEPKIINVIYMPAKVSFTVNHYTQNLEDDNYTLYDSFALWGYTGDTIGDRHLDIDGFHSLYYERMVIAADGSTKVDIYYNRDYYLVSFDLGGGFGLDPIYTRYGTEITAAEPTRPGYRFSGWSLTEVDGRAPTADETGRYLFSASRPKVIVEKNLTYLALWARGETSYTLVFWQENANDEGYSYWGSLTVTTNASGQKLLVDDVVDARDLVSQISTIEDEAYFTFNDIHSDKGVKLKGDGSSIVNAYYTRNYYTITFNAPGLCALEERHQHSDACYKPICGKDHVHTLACEGHLTCTRPEHTAHTAECLTCPLEAHVHGEDCSGVYGCGFDKEHEHTIEDCCGLTEHTHAKGCYGYYVSGNALTKPESKSGATSFPTGITTSGYIFRPKNNYQYIYIAGKWYKYTNKNVTNGMIVSPTCRQEEHTHVEGSDACINCGEVAHTHSEACIACQVPPHTHDASCYKDTIHKHTVNCYEYPNCEQHVHDSSCMKLICTMPTGHVHTDTCNSSSRQSTVKRVTRKYQSSLADIWPIADNNGKVYDDGQRWKPSGSTYYTQVLVYIADMPADDFTLTVDNSSYESFYMHYMLEVLPGEAYTATYNGKNFVESFMVTANYNYITRDEDFFDIKGFEQYGSNPAFSGNQIDKNGDVYFYYQRKTGGNVKLDFQNVNTVTKSYSGDGLMYGVSIGDFLGEANGAGYVPPYPSVYEPNAYEFDQWFTTPACLPGTEVDWEALTMPDGALTLYAHWVPVKHTVKIYKDASLTEQLGETYVAEHGTFLADPGRPSNGQLTFSGWFYKDANGAEKAFVFNGIPVKQDMDIYAKWSSRVAVRYTVYYKFVDADGNEIDVAPATEGSTIAGQNRTFDAKGGVDLYEAYREGYFPDASSHSIVMSAEQENTHTFYYVKKEVAPYTVRYLEAGTEKVLASEKYVDNNKLAVVTETFVPVSGYMPDSYQKRLVVSANAEENVLTFYYTPDEVHAYYRVVHYWQNLDGSGYTEHSHNDIKATIGDVCKASRINISGFSFKEARIDGVKVSVANDGSVSGTLGENGMLIAFYYDRQTVDYTVHYVEYGNTSNQLVAAVTKQGLYGAFIEESALDLTALGYSRVSEQVQRITLKETGRNVITFTYQENTTSYQYVAMMGGEQNQNYSSAENVTVLTGTPAGRTPIATSDYTFVGWFKDAACTVAVDPAVDPVTIDENNKLTPKRADTDGDGIFLYEGGVYYAKFDYNFTTMSITVQGSLDEEQAFLFVVQGMAGTASAGVNITVAVKGNSTVTLHDVFVGEYTVTQVTDWSWRYEPDGETTRISVSPRNESNNVTFQQAKQSGKWLDGNGHGQFLIP